MVKERTIILMAEDDEDDRYDAKLALEDAKIPCEIYFVEDGEELLDYLNRRNRFSKPEDSPRPQFILLDLNMPKMDGRKALEVIKSTPEFKTIPVIVFTTSVAEEDILQTLNLGANSYIQKPVYYEELVDIMRVLGKYWLEIVQTHPNGNN